LIAEFMGGKFLTAEQLKWADDCIKFEGEAAIPIKKHDYSTTWGLLMPVIEKICKHVYEEIPIDDGIEVRIEKDRAYIRTFGVSWDGDFMVRFNRQALWQHKTFIGAAFLAVIDFIQWYNYNNQG